MSLETSRHDLQLELSRARLVQFAECLVLPNHSGGGHAGGGFALVRLASVRCLERGAPVCNYISFHGRHPGDARLHFRTRTDHADRKSTRLNSSHSQISYAVFCLKKKI